MADVLDTDICLYWLHGKAEVKPHIAKLDLSKTAVTVITVAELYHGSYGREDSRRRVKELEDFLGQFRILPVNNEAAKQFGRIRAILGTGIDHKRNMDLLIASIAITSKRRLITNNIRDYEGSTGLWVDNWLRL